LEERLLGDGTLLWACATCGGCSERCPQKVKPEEVILALKRLLSAEGRAPTSISTHVERCMASGRSLVVTEASRRMRQELGLPPLPELPLDELQEILKP
jgi:heterodisulfide reductase subunit C